MKSNIWDEKISKEYISNLHEEKVRDIGIPSWALITCPYCKEKISYRNIREISLKLNARNIGDICIEFTCDKCKIMDTVYFRENIQCMSDFVGEILDVHEWKMSEPILEEEMYKLNYNNLLAGDKNGTI